VHLCGVSVDIWVFDAYFCDLSPSGVFSQLEVGRIVAAREVVYLATTLCAGFGCPVFLLLDIETVWTEVRTC
jgi:hypothetical protein